MLALVAPYLEYGCIHYLDHELNAIMTISSGCCSHLCTDVVDGTALRRGSIDCRRPLGDFWKRDFSNKEADLRLLLLVPQKASRVSACAVVALPHHFKIPPRIDRFSSLHNSIASANFNCPRQVPLLFANIIDFNNFINSILDTLHSITEPIWVTIFY
jgi:hypothetical protein